MKRLARTLLSIGVALTAGAASAQYVIEDWTVDAGGGRSQGGLYVMEATIGQPDADPLHPARGGPYALTGGYWRTGDAPPAGDRIFRNGFE